MFCLNNGLPFWGILKFQYHGILIIFRNYSKCFLKMFPDNRTDKVQAFQEPLETHGFCILLTYKARVSPSPLMTQYLLLFHLTHLWVYVFLNNLLDI